MSSVFGAIDGLHLSERASSALNAAGIRTPTPIQADGIPAVLAGQHVVMHSGTGTGKTLAYVLPILQLLEGAGKLRAVVFAPGAELAMQTLRVVTSVGPEALSSAAAVSTTSQRRQRKRVQQSTRLVVGTPDRLIELFRAGKLKRVGLIVFDELDPILASKDSSFLSELLSRSEPKVQIVVASATLGKRSEAFISRFMEGCVRLEPAERPLVDSIAHRVVHIPRGRAKEVALARFVEENHCRHAIVFASDPRLQSHLFHYLDEHGLSPVTVTRQGSKAQRQRGLQDFREGKARLLLTTDAIARGLDLPEVDWVLHYDLPRAVEAYVHRAGRTGRAGREGVSVVFADDRSHGALRRLSRELGIDFEPGGSR